MIYSSVFLAAMAVVLVLVVLCEKVVEPAKRHWWCVGCWLDRWFGE